MASFRQSPVLLYLIMLLGFAMGFLYNSQLDPTANVPAIPATFQLTSLKSLEHITIDYSILTSPQFRELRVFGQLPVPVQSGGKDDLFR